MNLRNIFKRPSVAEETDPTVAREIPGIPEMAQGEPEVADASVSAVTDRTHPEAPESDSVAPEAPLEPWIVRDPDTFEREKKLMAHFWPQFQLEVIEDKGCYQCSTCWSGKLVPGIMEDMEWEILVIYNAAGGGDGDWNGAVTVYFLDPTASQIIETLGYRPACMQLDCDGTPVISNIRPIKLEDISAAEAIWHAFRFCHTIEKMCAEELPENLLRDNNYLTNWENESFPHPTLENGNTTENTVQEAPGSGHPCRNR